LIDYDPYTFVDRMTPACEQHCLEINIAILHRLPNGQCVGLSVPEENRDLAGRDFCANLTFSRKITIFRKFRLGAQFLHEFGTLRRANFPQKFANFAICAKIFVFSR